MNLIFFLCISIIVISIIYFNYNYILIWAYNNIFMILFSLFSLFSLFIIKN